MDSSQPSVAPMPVVENKIENTSQEQTQAPSVLYSQKKEVDGHGEVTFVEAQSSPSISLPSKGIKGSKEEPSISQKEKRTKSKAHKASVSAEAGPEEEPLKKKQRSSKTQDSCKPEPEALSGAKAVTGLAVKSEQAYSGGAEATIELGAKAIPELDVKTDEGVSILNRNGIKAIIKEIHPELRISADFYPAIAKKFMKELEAYAGNAFASKRKTLMARDIA